ncbi:MAG TPA: hypothetical protein VGN61_04485 [Verrucomicrobiae bacterium]
MLDQKTIDAWVHFELINQAGWFKNLLHGNAPFLEVALTDEDCFELNLGKMDGAILNKIAMPENWKNVEHGLYDVPATELLSLVKWIDDFFNKAVGEVKEQRLAGWIDGL